MDALFCTPAVRRSPISVASLKPRQSNATGTGQVGASPRNGNVNGGGSVAETSSSVSTLPLSSSRPPFPSPRTPLWFVQGGQESRVKEESEDLNISLLNEALNVDLSQSLRKDAENNQGDSYCQGDFIEGPQIQTSEEFTAYSLKESDDRDSEQHLTSERHRNDTSEHCDQSVEERNNKEEAEASNADNNQGSLHSTSSERGNWIMRILELRSFWKDRRKSGSGAAIEPCDSQKQKQGSSCEDLESSNNSCGCCHADGSALSSPVLEVPRIDVKHDRNSFSRFLHPVSLSDIRFYGRFSYLCNRAYSIPEIKPEDLLKNHGLHFITSSLEKKAEVANKAKESMISDKSSTTSSPGLKENSVSGKAKSKSGLPINPAVAYRVAATAASYLHSQTRYILPFKSMQRNTTDDDEKLNNGTGQDVKRSLNSELVEITTASHAKITTLDPEAAPGCETNPKSINRSIEIDECSELSSLSESEVASYIATSSVTAVVAAEEETKQAVANDLQSIHSSPCEWFICDDKSTCTRFFIIQGSDSLLSWKANLFFEPIKFEGSEVFVHRGIYEAAKGIYEQILPEVHAHLKTCGEASRFRFTGHSLGGSLSVLLNLMLLIRGAVPLSSLLPVITFGSPCIMCGGDYLLKKLGLSTSHVQSIVMHRDIVPRAFSCHYPDHIAEILKRLNANFRNHPCLDSQRLLYAPIGQLLILQPDNRVSPTHHLLPTGCALYVLGHFRSTEIDSEPSGAVQLRAAQIEFLNSPHPLETLSDPGAYGLKGSICRDHDSRNYLKTITEVLRHELKRLRRLERAQRRQIWWPLVITESSMTIQRSSRASIGMPVNRISRESIGMGSKKFVGAVSSISSVSYEAPRRFEFPIQIGVLLRRSKATVGRFTRLIASQHMQMGLLFLLSGRMLIVQICGKIYS